MPLREKLASKLSSNKDKESSELEYPNGLPTPPKEEGSKTSSEPPPPFAQVPPTPPQKEQPPTYTAEDANAGGPTAEELSSAFSHLEIGDFPTRSPVPEVCLAHLKLLHAIHGLKEDIGYTDGLFGIWDAKAEMSDRRDETLSKMREKRWALYIARAVERFESWWLKVLCPMDNAERLDINTMQSTTSPRYMAFTSSGSPMKWGKHLLPPLDVLMVWHAFMLNPRNYLEDCIRFGIPNIWATGMPWVAVNAAIDTDFNYSIREEARVSFVDATGHNWDNVDDPMVKRLNCPRCQQALEIPWTTCGQSEKPSKEEITELKGNGYGDRDLSFICHKCGGYINHELLRVAKFRKETENLIMKGWPLGGTILLPSTGLPDVPPVHLKNTYAPTFPNRLISQELRSKVLDLISPNRANPTMEDVKKLVEDAVRNRDIIRRVNHRGTFESSLLKRDERIIIRKMMSRYWENTSVFALELGGAVIRQSVFIDKMKSLDWLHSPAAHETMSRLIVKYMRFMGIMALYPNNTCVPTLDVDLAWHTHQLSPQSYFDYTVAKCRKFIDHDDKISEDALEHGFEFTSKTYEKMFQQVYSECTCWYCEAIRSRHNSMSGKVFGTSKHEKISNEFHASSNTTKLCPPDNSAHISTHNAVRAQEDSTKELVYERIRKRRQQDLDKEYEKARKRAKAKGRTLPPKDQYYYGAWGYPYMMYGPYMAVPFYGGIYYAGDPCIMPVGAGMAGSCAAGTCSGGVGAGGCGGPGGCGSGGGCGASGAAGCGGGGGGGGGGGCGGGGGGGGGCGGGGGGG